MFIKKKIKENINGLIIILIAFLISANIAWLNPAPGKESYQPNKKIPVFWQYNYDSGIEILTAAYFPKIFYKDNTRIDRPTYPIAANVLGKVSCLIICPIYDLTPLEKAGIGYILLKILIFSLSLFLLNEILINYLSKKEILLSNLLIFFSVISIGNIALFHTIELQFITPIIVIFLFLKLSQNYNFLKNIIFSIVIGILMLGKPNYAIYISLLIYCIYNKKFYECCISFIAHLFPLYIYNLYLNYLSLDLIFIGSKYGQATWFIPYILDYNFYGLIKEIFSSLITFCYLLFDNYNFWIILSIFGIYKIRKKLNFNYYFFITIFFLLTWFQIFVSDRDKTYMTSDLMIIIYPLASIGFYYLLNKIKVSFIKKNLIYLVFFYVGLTNILAYVNFPLIHPYDQPAKNHILMKEKMNRLIN